MKNLNDTWKLIKSHWREEFNHNEIFTDENEHIIIFKNKEMFIILGYLHINNNFGISASDFIEFIDFMEKLGKKNYNPFKIHLICNYSLSQTLKSSEILILPGEIDYTYVDYNSFHGTISFKPEDKTLSAKHSKDKEEFNKPWYHKKHFKVITDTRFEDWEKWSLKNYEREWFESNEIQKFDSTWDIQRIFSTLEIYIDDRFIFGFFVVWRDDSFEELLEF